MQPEQDPRDTGSIAVRGVWQSAVTLEIVHADQIALTFRGDYGVLTIGQIVEPILTPMDSTAIEQLRASGEIPIKPLARFSIPKAAIPQWAAVFATIAARADDSVEIKAEV